MRKQIQTRTENPRDRSMSKKRKKMSDIKKEIKETVKGMAEVAFDAVERLTFQGSAKPEPKKPHDNTIHQGVSER